LAERESQVPDFLKIPRPLQEKFYNAAEEEAESLAKTITELSSYREEMYGLVRSGIRSVEHNDAWSGLKIGVVDGSDIPAVNDRIGLRYGLYSVAYKLFRGRDPEDVEWFYGDLLRGSIAMMKETFLKILDLLTTYYERYVACSLLDEADLIMIDGSFFGYRAGCSMVKQEELNWRDSLTKNSFGTVYDLISRINELTVKLLESGKVFGVVKRVSTMAIDGYICYKQGPMKGFALSDRSILNFFMKQGQVLDYDLLGLGSRFDAFSWYRKVLMEGAWRSKEPDQVLREAERRVVVQLVADLTPFVRMGGSWSSYANEPVVKAARSTKRVFVKTVEDIPPTCVEFPPTMPESMRDLVISYVYQTANPATGLPLPLDLVDNLVSLPRGIGREFVNEVEAELLRRGISKESLLAIFSRYNPQKDEG